jgi:hypothetical protein
MMKLGWSDWLNAVTTVHFQIPESTISYKWEEGTRSCGHYVENQSLPRTPSSPAPSPSPGRFCLTLRKPRQSKVSRG